MTCLSLIVCGCVLWFGARFVSRRRSRRRWYVAVRSGETLKRMKGVWSPSAVVVCLQHPDGRCLVSEVLSTRDPAFEDRLMEECAQARMEAIAMNVAEMSVGGGRSRPSLIRRALR